MHRALRTGKLPANGFYLKNTKGQEGDSSADRRVAALSRASLLIARAANKGQQKHPPVQVRMKVVQGLAEQGKGKPRVLQAVLPGDEQVPKERTGRAFCLPE